MKVIDVRNVNEAASVGIRYLLRDGIREQSRNGTVLVAPEPVVTIYNHPTERLLFGELRDANPFFHLMESLWMLAGRNDLDFPMYFNKNFASYSDDGMTVHGAYGHRWREHFGYDQLETIAKELKSNPQSRRCVLSMWDATPMSIHGADDLKKAMSGGKDVPCNTAAYFDVRGGRLNMTVCCRSNDIIWGAYGANAVHFSILQEYLAAWIGVPVGVYRQMSNNYHAYTDVYDEDKLETIAVQSSSANYYQSSLRGTMVTPRKLVSASIEHWDEELHEFFINPQQEFHEPFFADVVVPMYHAWRQRKDGRGTGLGLVQSIIAPDWRIACVEWINRRQKKESKNA